MFIKPKRIEEIISAPMPDLESHIDISKYHINRKKHSKIDLKSIATKTQGKTGKYLKDLVNNAAIKAIMLGDDHIAQKHFDLILK